MIETGSDWFKNDVHPYYQFKKAHDNSIESLAFNPANNLEMVTGSNDKSIKIWDLQKFKPSSKFTGHTYYLLYILIVGVCGPQHLVRMAK